MIDIDYKGVYFGNDTNEQHFYEGGAHFRYLDLFSILENLLLTMPLERRGVSEEPKKQKSLEILESNDNNNNNSRNTKNINPLIDCLTQKLTEVTKDKENENNILEIFTFGEERNENNCDNKKMMFLIILI